jgi:hypothetical protein
MEMLSFKLVAHLKIIVRQVVMNGTPHTLQPTAPPWVGANFFILSQATYFSFSSLVN